MIKLANKIIKIIGIAIIAFALMSFFLIDNTVVQSSELFGKQIVVVNKNIKAGQVITAQDITSIKIKRDSIVHGTIEWNDAAKVVGKVAIVDINQNEQLVMDRLCSADKYYDNNTHFIPFTTNYVDSVAGLIKVGDLVDIWVKPNPAYPVGGFQKPKKLFEHVRLEQIKTESNIDVQQVQNGVPFVCIVRLTDEQITTLKTYIPDQGSQTTFLTLYPNQAAENTLLYGSDK